MILAIKDYLTAHPQTTSAELALQFDMPPSALGVLLMRLHSRGLIELPASKSCQGCGSDCSSC